ncbi:MAG: hypothetical protein ABIK62_04830, partial [candidate division WOR-3 bacterium]
MPLSGGPRDRSAQSEGQVCRSPELIAERYQVLALLGGGVTSEVFKVKDLATNRILALKTSKKGVSHDEELALNREFYHLSRFNHSNIVKVCDFGT